MLDFLKELTRRKVWLFGGIYLAVAWVMLQIVVTVEATMNLPDWIDQSVLVLLVVGFPFVLLLAWAQESRIKAPVATSEETTAHSEFTNDAPSVVILPFRARADDDIEQLTAEGLTDDITTLLTMVKGIKVAPRQAVGRMLGPDDDPLQMAHDLGCRYAVTGSVRRNGDKLRVSTELTDISAFDRPERTVCHPRSKFRSVDPPHLKNRSGSSCRNRRESLSLPLAANYSCWRRDTRRRRNHADNTYSKVE